MNKAYEDIPPEEGYLVEFKDFAGGVSVKELAKTLCSFANTEGGSIYVGVTDRRQISGVKVTPAVLDHVQNAAREGCAPPVPISLSEIEANGKRVLRVTVEKTGHLHSVAAGQTYIRVGTQDKRILGEELLRLAETKSQVSFEDHLLEAGMEVISEDALAQYYNARRATSAMRGNIGSEELLVKMGLARRGDGRFRISAGAFILFGKEEEAVLLQRDFTFVKYDAEGEMYSFRDDVSMPASRTIERLMELVRPYNRIVKGVRGAVREESSLYPEDAVREALINALAHRDYRLCGLRNEFRIYPNRMELISAGGLAGFITLENIDKRHYSRNPKMMHALMTLGLVEELGQGINMMKRRLAANGNPKPEFVASPDQFKVIFYRPPMPRGEADIELALDRHFISNRTITRRQLEAIMGVGSTTAMYIIEDLLKKRYLKRSGRGPATRYERYEEIR